LRFSFRFSSLFRVWVGLRFACGFKFRSRFGSRFGFRFRLRFRLSFRVGFDLHVLVWAEV